MNRPRADRIRWCVRCDSGASAVEFGLLLPLFVMLTLGTISAGFAFHAWLGATQGAQESSRFAATLSIDASGGSTTTWLTEVGARALAAADINPAATDPGTSVCVAVVSPTNVPPLNSHMMMVADSSGVMVPSAALAGSCPGAATSTGDFVQTNVDRPVDFNYLLGSAKITVTGKSLSRYEAVSLS